MALLYLMGEIIMHVLNGSCHCGNINLEFKTPNFPESLWLRKCPCSFCRKQGNINVADPEGLLSIHIANKEDTFIYKMGHKTSDRLFCKVCGVYIGGLMTYEGKQVGVLNANTLAPENVLRPPTEINVSAQSPEERIQGRMSRWMPFEIIFN